MTMTITNSISRFRVILGTVNLVGQKSSQEASKVITEFCSKKWRHITHHNHNYPMIDTSISCQRNNETEPVLARLFQESNFPSKTISLSIKADSYFHPEHKCKVSVRQLFDDSLRSLHRHQVDLFILHAPQVHRPIEQMLDEIHLLHQEGRFQHFGLSNFNAWETMYVHSYMLHKGYIRPTVYQGVYNGIARHVEQDLLPTIRKLHMTFHVRDPLVCAGGMLTGKYHNFRSDQILERDNANAIMEQRLADASYRWLCHHSQLTNEDGIIIDASSAHHLTRTMESIVNSTPLPQEKVNAFNRISRLEMKSQMREA